MAASDHLQHEQFPHWTEQSTIVEGVSRPLRDISGGKWYHASDHAIEVGQTVSPGKAPRNHKESPTASVSISSDASYARHWGSNLYEVEPDGRVEGHRVSPAEYGKKIAVYEARVPRARVLGVVRKVVNP